MAPTKVKTGSARGNNKRSTKPSKSASSTSSKKKTSGQKTSSTAPVKRVRQSSSQAVIKKPKGRRLYTEEELKIPRLNMITPAGVQKSKGKKKGKVFVDDNESMMTILAMVNAEKEGQIESKMMKARQMEEIRQARQKEMEARAEEKKSKLEETKASLRRNKKKTLPQSKNNPEGPKPDLSEKPQKKRVSFG